MHLHTEAMQTMCVVAYLDPRNWMTFEKCLYEVVKGTLMLGLSCQRHEVVGIEDKVTLPRSNSEWLLIPDPCVQSSCILWWTFAQSTKASILQGNVS